jgi:hypothetical protein
MTPSTLFLLALGFLYSQILGFMVSTRYYRILQKEGKNIPQVKIWRFAKWETLSTNPVEISRYNYADLVIINDILKYLNHCHERDVRTQRIKRCYPFVILSQPIAKSNLPD